jgi:hypothetical protein
MEEPSSVAYFFIFWGLWVDFERAPESNCTCKKNVNNDGFAVAESTGECKLSQTGQAYGLIRLCRHTLSSSANTGVFRAQIKFYPHFMYFSPF